MKLIDELSDLNSTLKATHRRPVEIFEFFQESPTAGLEIPSAAIYSAIKVDSLDDIKEMIK
ncbi:hypothetical protein D3C76_1566660 [compost metagenome]